MAITAETRQDIIELVVTAYNAAPGTTLLTELVAIIDGGGTLADVANTLTTSTQWTTTYPSFQTAEEFAAEWLGNLVPEAGEDALAEGVSVAVGLINGGASFADLIIEASTFLGALSEDDEAFGSSAANFNNKVEVATYHTITQETDGIDSAALASVTSDDASVASAKASVVATETVPGQTYTLTTNAETVTGTAGDDRFVAVTIGDGNTGTTLMPGDVIEGGAGTDTLLLSTSGAFTAAGDYTVAAIQASGLEVVHLNGFDTDADNVLVDLTLMGADVQEVGLASSNATGDVSFVNPKSFVDATMNNGSADLTITYGALALGSSDVQNLSLANVSAGTATFASVETVNVSTSLAKSKLTDLVIDGATALNISGDQKLTIASDVNFKDNSSSTKIDGTIDASGSTGGVDLTFSSADNLAITGGSGDDVIRMGTSKNYYDTIDGGDGEDTVAISLSAASGAGVDYSYALAGLSNVENLDVTSTNDAASVDMKGISADITNVTLGSNVRTYQVTAVVNSTAIAFTLNGVGYETAATDGSATAAEAATLIGGVIDALTGFSATVSTDTVTITSVSGNAIEISQPTGGATAATVGAYTEAAITNLPDDGSVSVTLHSADDVTLGLADGSGSSDVVNLKLGTVTADKGFEKTIKSVTIAAVETLNIDVSGMTDKIDTNITTLTADSKLTAINITGDSDLDMTGTVTASKLATIDASAATGDVAIDVPALTAGSTVKGGSGADNFVFQGSLGLNAYDVVTGGEGTDKLQASIAGMTGVYAPLGVLNVTDVETLNLTTTGAADASIDATGIVGATEVGISGAGGTTTLSNLAAGVNLGLGIYASDSNTSGRVDVSLADATGTEDALTVKLNDRDGGANNAIDLRASGIETVTFTVSGYSTDSALADHTLTVNRLNATTINVTGSTRDSGNTLSLGTLDTDTTTVDASTYNGVLTATAGTGVDVSISAKGDRVHTLNGSTGDDTFTLVGTVTNADSTIVGGGGDDTLNLTVGDGAADFDGVSAIDTINMTVSGGSAVTTNADADVLDGINESTKLVVTGGNSLSTVTLGGTGDAIDGGSKTNVLDFSGYGGKAVVYYAADGFDDLELGYTQQVIGGASLADTIVTSYDADTDATVAINTQGVEAFQFTLGDSNVELVMDMTKVTGLGQINVLDTSDESVEIANLMAGTKVYAETTDTTNTVVEVKLASTTGSEDALTLGAAAASANDNLKFVVADVETVTIASLSKLLSATSTNSNEVDLDLSGISMTAAGATTKVVLTGGVALELTATNADIATIDASARTAGVVQTGRSAETGSTYTGGSGADTFIMMSGSDVLTGGLGSDTLDVNLGAVLGGISVDLSSATNQVASMDGGAISGTVLGFENVDLSGYTGFGAVVQAIKTGSTITGTGSIDRITGGASADVITGGAGKDVISAGGGNDTINIANGTDIDLAETINGGSGTDELVMLAVTTAIDDADFANMTSIETLTLANGTNTAVLGTNASAAGITTVNGGTGADAINVSALTNNNTIVSGGGAETIIVSTAANSTVTLAAAGAITTLTTSSVGAGYFNVSTFAVAEDVLDYNGAVLGDDGSTAVVAGKEGSGIADIASIATDDTVDLVTVAMTNDIIDDFLAGTKTLAEFKAAALVSMGDGGATTATQTAITGLDTALADTSKVLIFTVDNEDTAIWYVNNTSGGTGGANVLAADEISLVGIIQGDVLSAAEMATIVI